MPLTPEEIEQIFRQRDNALAVLAKERERTKLLLDALVVAVEREADSDNDDYSIYYNRGINWAVQKLKEAIANYHSKNPS